ncbi:MarR family transcriptional regulator [soil metagenome]
MRDEAVELSLEWSFGYVFKNAHRAFTRAVTKRLKPYGITLAQWYFLRELWQEQGMTQRELSRRMSVTEATTTVALDSMEKSGLIERNRDTVQRNSLNVFLTEKGQALKDDLLQIALFVNSDATKGISKDKLTMVRDCVATMIENLGET